jgi:hypothetical protein
MTPATRPLLLGILLSTVACLPVRYTERFVPEGEIREILVRSDSGDVELRSADSLRIQRTIRAPDGAVELSHTVEDGKLTLDAHCTTLLPCGVDLEIDIPEGVAVRVEIDQGEVWATGLARLQVKVGMGDVDVDVDGPLNIRVGQGSIQARIDTRHTARLAVGMGDVSIQARGAGMAMDISAAVIRVDGLGHDPDSQATLQVVAPAGEVSIRGLAPVASR